MENKQLKILIPFFGIMLFLVNGDTYATSPMLIQIANEFGLNITVAGLSFVTYMLPFGFFTLIFGPLSEKFGKVVIINIAAFSTAIFSIVGGFAPNFITLCLCRALNGAFAAAIMPVSMALIGEKAGQDQTTLQSSLGKIMALMFLGGAVAPAIGGLISFFGSWRIVYIIYGILEFIMSVLILSKIRIPSQGVALKGVYKEAFANRNLIGTVLIISLVGMAVLGTFTYMGKFIEQKTGYSILIVGLILSCFGIGSMIGGRVSVKLRQKFQSKYFIFTSLIGVVSLLSFVFFPIIEVIPFALLGFGLSFMLIQPMLIAKAQSLFSKHRGIVMSMCAFNMCVGGGVGTLINGAILKNFSNYIYIFIIPAVLFGIIGLVLTILEKKVVHVK